MASGAVDRLASGSVSQVGGRYAVLAVCAFLLLAVALVFGQTASHDFVNFDDDVNVYDNPMVTAGVTLKGLAWAFLHPSHVDYWRPLSFLSHMLDCQLYGLWAGGHHLTNVLLHLVAAVVLFLVLRAMTGGMWRSAFVAAVFAIHPLRVESVAWVTERKDVLGALFFVLTLAAYVRYARQPALGRYGAVVVLFALGLMCKPTLVPLPLVLLLLDYWPLGRTGVICWRALLLEKLPLLVLAAGSCFVTVLTGASALQPVKDVPLLVRMGNTLVSLPTYVGQLFWPAGLAPWYPNPKGGQAVWAVALAVVALVAVSAAVIGLRRRQPWLLTGWFWYLAMLATTVSTSQARMDRFTYLSQIGVCVALTWAAAELTARVARLAAGGALCGGGGRGDGVEHRRARPDLALAEQRDLVDAHLGLYLAKFARPQQPRKPWPIADRPTRLLPISVRPWKSGPTTWKPTAAWALSWPAADRSMRLLPITARPWKSSPTTLASTTKSVLSWPTADRSTRLLPISRRPWKASLTTRRLTITWESPWPTAGRSTKRSPISARR